MPKVASEFSKEDKKTIQITTTHDDYEFLKGLADEAGVTQGFALHTFFEMVQLVVGAAKESATLDEETKMPALEAFVLLILRHMGLVADDEFNRAVILADAMEGKRADLRLSGLGQMANERLEQLRPIWEAARAEAKYRKATEWDPKEALRRHKLAADAGAAMVAADSEVNVNSSARAPE